MKTHTKFIYNFKNNFNPALNCGVGLKKKLILPLLIGLAIILTGCTIPIVNKEVRMPWEKKPADVIKQAMANSASIKSSHYQSTIKIEAETSQALSFQNLLPNLKETKVLGDVIDLTVPSDAKIVNNTAIININTGGQVRITPLGNTNIQINKTPNIQSTLPQKISLTLSLNGDTDFTDTKSGKMTADFDIKLDYSSLSLALGGELRNVNKLSYLKIDTIPNIPLLSQSLPSQWQQAINELQGTWLKIDPEEIQNYLKNSNTLSITGLPNVNQEDTYKKYSDLIGKMMPKIQSALASANIYSYQSLLTSEKINGVNCYHYKVALDKEGLKRFMIQLAKIYSTEAASMSNQGLPTNINENDVNKQVDSFFKYLNTNEGEVWIGQKDFMTYKMQWHLVMKNPDDTNSSQVKLDFASTFSDFNTPKTIKAPDQSKSIIDAYTELMAKASGKTTEEWQAQKRDAQRLSDISQIRTALVLYADDHELKYPKTLDELAPDYISQVPVNPVPGGGDYTYEPSKDFKSFTLSFLLEVGTGSYGAGLHVLIPDGIDKGEDSDSDGLTDDQENYFGTDSNKADTDGDGYKDGEEVKNGYNPNGVGKLELNKYKFGQ